MVSDPKQTSAGLTAPDYHPRLWEQIVAAAAAVTIVGLVGFLVVRNQPFSDQNLVVFVRILLAFATSLLGATIPGTLHVKWSGKGVAVRAAGAVGLFVLTLFFTPTALVPSPTAPKSEPIKVTTGKTVVSPANIYFGSSYDSHGETSTPDYKVTDEVKKSVQKNAEWIASFDDSVESVVISSHIDEGVSAEMALALSENGGDLVKNLLADEGINRHLIRLVAYGKEQKNPLFETDQKHLKRNYNNYVSVAVVLK
jgi:outer membrane protein OmpA-like peptidoglycan-associated protein